MEPEAKTALIAELKAAKSVGKAKEILQRLAKIEIEAMHLLPQQFLTKFEKAGLDIKDYIRPIEEALHRLNPDGLHTINGGNWNKVWREFFDKYPNAKKPQILAQLAKMLRDFGLE